ncbi:MAG: PEP-CTERM system TPR-repeat protein PrsT [Rhodospirillales bacterium]|nr:PEP-CTERM system TPR-repeat protein PrsT [Rhodospirillales bacterium]
MKKLLIAVPLLFVVLLGGAVWWRYGHAPSPYTVAQQLLLKGDIAGAQIALRRAVLADPRNSVAHFRLGEVSLRMGDPVAAEKELRTARDLGFDPRAVNPLLARSYLAQGHDKALLRDFPVQGLPPDQAAPLLVMRSLAQLSLGQAPAARREAEQAERLAPQSVDAALATARVAVAMHDPATAESKVARALQINPRSVDALLLKGQLANLRGDRTGALDAFDAVLALNPDLVAARLERANILLVTGKDSRAAEDVDAVLKAEPRSAMGTYLHGVLRARAKDFAGADKDFTRVGGLLPRFPRGLYFLAIVKYNLGQAEQARDAASQYLQQNPNDLPAIKLFARIELAGQRPARAIDALSRAVNAGSADGETFDLLGRAYSLAGQPQQALASFEHAAILLPDDAGLLTRLAATRMALGDSAHASDDLEHALKLSPTQQGARASLVIADITAGELDRAAVALAGLRKAEGDSATVGNLTALLQMSRLDLAGARATLLDTIKRFPETVQPRLNLAKIDMLQNRSADALAVLEAVLQREPANPAALSSTVTLLLADGKSSAALARLQSAHVAAPEDAGVTIELADMQSRFGHGKEALALLVAARKAAEAHDAPAALRQSQGALQSAVARTQIGLGDLAGARDTYRAMLEHNPADIPTRRALADLLVGQKDPAAAKAVIAEGLKSLPGNAALLEAYAGIVLKADGLQAALDAGDKLAADPANLPAARLLRGDIDMAAGHYADAVAAFQAAMKVAPSAGLVLRLANALNAGGHNDQSSQVLRDWLGAHPGDVPVADALGSLDIQARRFFDAEAHLGVVLAARPQDAVALNNLAWVYQQRGDARARATAQKAYLIAPTPQAADTLGWILTSGGDAETGLSLLRQAGAQLWNDPTVQYHLAVALNATHHDKQALATLRPIVQGLLNFDDRPAALRLYQQLSGPR